MPSERLIDAMARAIMEARDPEFGNGCGCKVVDWASEEQSNPHVAQAVAQARAALRALHDHGPTPEMRRAFWDAEDPTDAGFAKGFRAMLAAELEKRQAHA